MRIAVINAQSGIGTTKGYWQYLTSSWKYLFPQTQNMSAVAGTFIQESTIDIGLCVEVTRTVPDHSALLVQYAGLPHSHFFMSRTKRHPLREGSLLLSSFPIQSTRTHELTSGVIPRILAEAALIIDEVPIRVYIAHLALGRATRTRQLQEIASIIKRQGGPFILGGDFNERDATGFEALIESGVRHQCLAPTYPSWAPRHSLECLFLSDKFTNIHSEKIPSREAFSDHLPLVVEATFRA